MRRLLILLSFLLCLASPPAQADAFVAGTEDIPLMPGLKPVPNSTMVFDKPEGRIVEAQAQGSTTRAKVEAFYATSLPPLGWKRTGLNQWQREAERLRLEFHGATGIVTVGFTLSPH
jgi:hypothetical protein